jgi:hypothetical protein
MTIVVKLGMISVTRMMNAAIAVIGTLLLLLTFLWRGFDAVS